MEMKITAEEKRFILARRKVLGKFFIKKAKPTYDDYDNYEDAMYKNDAEPLEEQRWINYIKNYCSEVRYKNSALFGKYEFGAFFVSHWSPSSYKEGLELIKKVSKNKKVPFVFNVTKKLGKMLEKIGLKFITKVNVNYPYPQIKYVYSNFDTYEIKDFIDNKKYEPDKFEKMSNNIGFMDY